jgi:hypothetical protein
LFITHKECYLLGAILIVSNWPYTLWVIMPNNKKLMAISADRPTLDTRILIIRWGKLHVVRSLLGVSSTIAFFLALTL